MKKTIFGDFLKDGYDNDFDGNIDEFDEAWDNNYHAFNPTIGFEIKDSGYKYKFPPQLGKAYYNRTSWDWDIIPPWLHKNEDIVWVDGSGNEYPNYDNEECSSADQIAWYFDTIKMINEDFDPENRIPSPYQHSLGVCEDYAMLTVGYLRSIGISSRVACGYGTRYWIPWGPHAWTQWKNDDIPPNWKHLDVSFIGQHDSWERSKYDPDVYRCKWDYVLVRNSEDPDDVLDISGEYNNINSIESVEFNQMIGENSSKTYMIIGNPIFYPGEITAVDLEITNGLDFIVNSTIVVELIPSQPFSTTDCIALSGQYKNITISNCSTIYETFELEIPADAFPSTNYLLNVYDVSDDEKLVLSNSASVEKLFATDTNVQGEVVLNSSFKLEYRVQNICERTVENISIDIGVGDTVQTDESTKIRINTLEPGHSENLSWNLIPIMEGDQHINIIISSGNAGSMSELIPIQVFKPAEIKLKTSVIENMDDDIIIVLLNVSNSGDIQSEPLDVTLSFPANVSSNTTTHNLDPINGHGSRSCAFEILYDGKNDFPILVNVTSGDCIVAKKNVFIDINSPNLFIDLYLDGEEIGIDFHKSTVNKMIGSSSTVIVYLRNNGDTELSNVTLMTNTGFSRIIQKVSLYDEYYVPIELCWETAGQGMLNVTVSSDEIVQNFSRPYLVKSFGVDVSLLESSSFINSAVPVQITVSNDVFDTKFNNLIVTTTISNSTHAIVHNETTISLSPLEVYDAGFCWDTSGLAPGNYSITTCLSEQGDEVATEEALIMLFDNCPPIAGIRANQTSGIVPFTVYFTDTSTGNPNNWSWDFGDDVTSTEQNPTHTYQTEGTYNVTLIASNAYGFDTETRTDYISVTSQSVLTVDIPLAPGWNMISIPVNNAELTIPSQAGDMVYVYDPAGQTYVAENIANLEPCKGYWVSATAACTLSASGNGMECYATNLSPGWNMIGSVCKNISFENIEAAQTGSVLDYAYSYDPQMRSYVSTTTLNPCCGYWVSAREYCTLDVGTNV